MKMVEQLGVCQKYGATDLGASDSQACGVALQVGRHGVAVNGRRHAPSDWTSGWFVWCGENLATDADDFDLFCMSHLIDRVPTLQSIPGLAPGHVDVWFHEALLTRDYRTEMFGRFSQ